MPTEDQSKAIVYSGTIRRVNIRRISKLNRANKQLVACHRTAAWSSYRMRDLYLFRSILKSNASSCDLDRPFVLDQGTDIDVFDLGL